MKMKVMQLVQQGSLLSENCEELRPGTRVRHCGIAVLAS